MFDSCVICCLNYNLSTRRPWDLGCGHCVCEQCYNTSKLTQCVECRQPANNPHLQYTLLRMLQPGSPTSFPIGVASADAEDEAPGTPTPSAPSMEVELWDPDSDNDSRRCSQRSSSAGSLQCNSLQPPVQQQHRLSHQSSYSSMHSNSITHSQRPISPSAPSAPAMTASFYPLPVLGQDLAPSSSRNDEAAASTARHVPVHALEVSSATTWTATGGTVTMGIYTTASANSIVSHQAFLTSFPVEDFDLLECLPASPTSSQADVLDDISLEAGQVEEDQPVVNRTLAAVQEALNSCTVLMQQLLVPQLLFDTGLRQGWPAPGPSLILAATSSSWRVWSAYSSALKHTLAYSRQLQLILVSMLGRIIRAVGLPNIGHLAAYMLATWLLGVLLYHWGLGVQLLPIAAAALGLLSFSAMSSSSSGCSLWPGKLAGALVAGDCLVVGLLGLLQQQTGLGAAMHSRLLKVTPQLLLVALLLVWGQVVFEVVFMGWANYRDLKFASLVARCWCVAAAAALFSSPSGTAAAAAALAAIPWVQKCHLLLEAPVIVHHLGLLLQSTGVSSGQEPGTAAVVVQEASSSSHAAISSSSNSVNRSAASSMRRFDSVRSEALPTEGASDLPSSGNGAWLLCVHVLLQLSVLLFVPPAPLAAVSWLPGVVQDIAVWASRVLLCGCIMQLVLNALLVKVDVDAVQQQASNSSNGVRSGQADTVYAGVASSRASTGKIGSRGQPRLKACGGDVDSCRPSSSCSMAAHDCMMLATRSVSPCASHGGRGVQLHQDSNNISHISNFPHWGSIETVTPCDLRSIDCSSRAGLIAGTAAVVRQHVTYLALLVLAAAGDSFITAVPSAGGAVRAAWHVCVQQMLVVMFCGECMLTAWHEVMLFRYQQQVAPASLQRPEASDCRAQVCTP